MMIRVRISLSAEEFEDGTRSAPIASAGRSETFPPLSLRPFVERLRRRAREIAVGLERQWLASEPSDIVARDAPEKQKNSRIVVAIADPARAAALSAVASVLALQRDAEIVFLHIQLKGAREVEQPPHAVRIALDEAETRGASAGYLVRVAPNIGRAIRRTVLEQRAGLLILGWRAPDSPPKVDRPVGTEITAVLEDPPCDVAVVGGAGMAELSRLVVNSAAVIIGAMLVAPLLSSMVGIGLGIVAGNGAIVRRSLGAVIRGSLLALAVGYVVGLMARGQPATSEMLARGQPTLWDLGVALASGAAGAYALGRESVRASMAGVAIAAAVVPPLVAAGITLAWGLHAVSVGALLLFLTNAVAIALAGAITFLLLGFAPAPERHAQRRFLGRAMRSVAISTVVVVIVLAGLTWRLTRVEQQDRAIRSAIATELDAYGAEVMELRHVSLGSTTTVTVTATLPENSTESLEDGTEQAPPVLDKEALEAIRASLSAALDRSVRLSLTVVPVRRIEVPYP